LDIPPILAGKSQASCNDCNACDPACTNPCTTCSNCCGTTCMDSNASCSSCCDGVCDSAATCPPECTEANVETNCGANMFCCDGQCKDSDCSTVGKLNDTGITVSQATGDDAEYGRDADPATNSDDDGHAGFDFSVNGDCIKDNVTNLLWSPTVQDQGAAVTMDYSTAEGQAANADLCGKATGWRIPTITELLSLVSYDRTGPTIDTNVFQDTQASWYWTATDGNGGKWGVTFNTGSVTNTLNNDSYLRLVNGPELTGNFSINTDGDIEDANRSLIWKRCFAGYDWNGSTGKCEGNGGPIAYVWKDSDASTPDALDLTANGWRLPNLKELQSITGESLFPLPVEYANPSLSADTYVWSSSPYAGDPTNIWLVNATSGLFVRFKKDELILGQFPPGVARLVKDAP